MTKTQSSPPTTDPPSAEKCVSNSKFIILNFFRASPARRSLDADRGLTRPPKPGRRQGFLVLYKGFTMVEVVIMLAILVLVAGIVLASFPALSQRVNLQHSSQNMALALRRAQNMALAVRQVDTLTRCGRIVPDAYGVSLNMDSPSSYIIFADFNLNVLCARKSADKVFNPSSGLKYEDVIVETVSLDRGISLLNLVPSSLGQPDTLNITFSSPEARISIYGQLISLGETAEIFMTAQNPDFTRSVVVRTSGQIYSQ